MESAVARLVKEEAVFNRLEAVQRLKAELAQLEFIEKSDYLLRTWGRIQPELDFLKYGEDHTQVSEWVHNQLPGFGLISLNRRATSREYDLKLRFKLGGIHFTSSFTNQDRVDDNDDDEGGEEESEPSEEEEEEESVGEDHAENEQVTFDHLIPLFPEDIPEQPQQDLYPDYESYEEEADSYRESDDEEGEEENSYDDDEEEDEQSPTGDISKVAYKLEMIDPTTGAPVVLLNLSFTICTSHLPNEILFYDDLTNEDNLNEDLATLGNGEDAPGPMEVFYSTSGYQESTTKWEDEPYEAATTATSKPTLFKLDNEMCKCTCCGVEHLYSVQINWPALQTIAFSGSEPSMVTEMGRSLTSPSAFTLISQVRTLVLLMVLSGAGTSGFVFSPLEFLFQSLLSDVFDRFGTRKLRFDDTIEFTDPELGVD